jgi:RNA polymerase sigma-70 factor (ECF subfamily)
MTQGLARQDVQHPSTPPIGDKARLADDVPSFARELAALRPRLYRYALRLTAHPASADDLVQEAIARALAARQRFRVGSNLVGWLKTIIRNHHVDGCRHNSMHRDADCDRLAAPEAALKGPLDVLSLADVQDAVTGLSHLDRELFTLAYQRRLHHRAISQRLGIPVSTAGVRLFRVRRKLRRLLHETYTARLAHTGLQGAL